MTAVLCLQPLLTLHARLEPTSVIAQEGGHSTRLISVSGGHFVGPRLSGQIMPGLADCVTVRADGTRCIDVRLRLETDDGATILMRYGGRLVDTVDGPEAHIAPLFEASGCHAWLNAVQAFGVGRPAPGSIAYSIFHLDGAQAASADQ